ncbi:MAG: PH domain-containing protein [Woeseiaceae bacterium]|nr:PH domain-containing protein [Woeseiaceae bacterium]
MFENPEIPLDALPDVESPHWESLHPRFVRCLQLQHLLIALIPVVVAAIVTALLYRFVFPITLMWLIVLAVGTFVVAWPAIAVPRRGYVVRDKDIIFRSGVVFRSVTAIPYNRIQHVETSSTPFDRRFGVASLQIFTAGGSGGDLKIGGLGRDVAEKLRVYILDKAGASIEDA